MDTQKVEYKNIYSSVRTPKVVTLVSNKDKYWKHTILRIIEFYSKMWGGDGNLIIPTDGKKIDDHFWKILENYSPDYLISYDYSFASLSIADPKKYFRIINARKNKLKKAFPKMENDDLDDHVKNEAEMSHYVNFEIDNNLQEELKQRLSPFYFRDHVSRERVSWNSKVSFPFTPIEKIIANTNVKNMFSVELPDKYKNINIQLMVYSILGHTREDYINNLINLGINVKNIPNDYPLKDILDDLLKGGVDLSAQKLEKELFSSLKTKNKKHWLPDSDYLKDSPFSLSMCKLGKYYKVGEHKDWEESVVLIIGNSIEDFCYYYSLSKAHGDFYWLPISMVNKFNNALSKKIQLNKKLTELEAIPYVFVHSLFAKIDYGYKDKNIVLTSLSLDEVELEKVKKIFKKAPFTPNFDPQISKNTDFSKCMLNTIELDNFTNQQTITFVNDTSVGQIDTPKPKNFTYINPSEHRWITEINIDGYKLPPLHFLGHETILLSDSHDTRVSKNGISYLSPSIGYFGGEVDSILIKPRIHLLDSFKIFSEYYKEAGYKRVAISDKGLISQRAVDKFGSIDKIGGFIASEGNRILVNKFVKHEPFLDGTTKEEIVKLRGINYLNFQSISLSLGGDDIAIQEIDKLVTNEILHRGFIFQCEACLKSDWYGIEITTRSFKCSRCGHKQIFRSVHWKTPNEPPWYYKLDEVIRLGFEQNMQVPLTTIFKLKQQSKESFLYSPEIALWKEDPLKGKPDLEIDINCIIDGEIVVGESKVNSISPSEISKYSSFVKTLKKYPNKIIFSTFSSDNEWSKKVKDKIATINDSEMLFSKDLLQSK